jgi:hypothetical protein
MPKHVSMEASKQTMIDGEDEISSHHEMPKAARIGYRDMITKD